MNVCVCVYIYYTSITLCIYASPFVCHAMHPMWHFHFSHLLFFGWRRRHRRRQQRGAVALLLLFGHFLFVSSIVYNVQHLSLPHRWIHLEIINSSVYKRLWSWFRLNATLPIHTLLQITAPLLANGSFLLRSIQFLLSCLVWPLNPNITLSFLLFSSVCYLCFDANFDVITIEKCMLFSFGIGASAMNEHFDHTTGATNATPHNENVCCH